MTPILEGSSWDSTDPRNNSEMKLIKRLSEAGFPDAEYPDWSSRRESKRNLLRLRLWLERRSGRRLQGTSRISSPLG